MFLGVTLYLHRDQSHGGLILHPALRHLFRFWLWFSSARGHQGMGRRAPPPPCLCRPARRSAQSGRVRPAARALRGLRTVRRRGARSADAQELTGAARRMTGSSGTSTPAIPTWASCCSSACTCWLFGVAGHHHDRRAPDGAAVLRRRGDQRPRSRGGLPQLRDALDGDQPRALGPAARRRGTAQQPSRLPALGALRRAALGTRHRLAVDPAVPGAAAGARALGRAAAALRAPPPRARRRDRAGAVHQPHARAARLRAPGGAAGVPRAGAQRAARCAAPRAPRKLLIRHPAVLAEEARRRLRELLERYEVLRRVVEYREALQQLWNEAAANRGAGAGAAARVVPRGPRAAASVRCASLRSGLPAYAR